ncbi:MAG TPA: ribonuclease P protein component [Candidatus Omnitrophota bacterium]|nr:ribonuclease P protein component [Candidatus Omnitrophota bacterium]
MTAGKHTFRKDRHLTRRTDFADVLRNGRAFRYAVFQLICRPREQAEATRLGIGVAKRNFKKAVDRNRIKRWVRECFRKREERFLFPCDLMVRVFSGKESRIFGEFKEAFDEALRKAGLLGN